MLTLPAWSLPYIFAAVIVAFTALIAWIVGLVVRGAMGQSAPQVAQGARRLATVAVWVVGVLLAVQEIGISVDVLLVVLALVGVAAILACRQSLENFGAKYFSEVYTPFKVGDSIEVGPFAGKVIEINAISTVLLSSDDRLLAVPNSMILREGLVNVSPQAWKELTIPISVPGNRDIAPLENEVMKSLGKLRPRLDKRFPPVLTTRARTPQSTDLILTVMIRRPEDRDPLLAEVNKRVHAAIERTRMSVVPAPSPAPEAAPPS